MILRNLNLLPQNFQLFWPNGFKEFHFSFFFLYLFLCNNLPPIPSHIVALHLRSWFEHTWILHQLKMLPYKFQRKWFLSGIFWHVHEASFTYFYFHELHALKKWGRGLYNHLFFFICKFKSPQSYAPDIKLKSTISQFPLF